MGFMDKFGEYAGKAVRASNEMLQEKARRIERYKQDYDRYDDRKLMQEMKRTTDVEKRLACAQLLKERGYGPSNN